MPKKNSPGCCGCGGAPCANLTVRGRGCAFGNVAGLAVSLTFGGTTISSGTTNSSGTALLPFYATGVYTLTVSDPLGRLVTSVTTVTLTCPTDSSATVTLSPAAGFHCKGDCARPLKETLFYSDSAGALTLSWIPTLFSGGGWGVLAARTLTSSFPQFAARSTCGTNGVTLVSSASASVAYLYDGVSMIIQVFGCTVNPGVGGGSCASITDPPALPWPTSTCPGGHPAGGSARTLSSLVCPGAAYSASGAFASIGDGVIRWIYGASSVPWSLSE